MAQQCHSRTCQVVEGGGPAHQGQRECLQGKRECLACSLDRLAGADCPGLTGSPSGRAQSRRCTRPSVIWLVGPMPGALTRAGWPAQQGGQLGDRLPGQFLGDQGAGAVERSPRPPGAAQVVALDAGHRHHQMAQHLAHCPVRTEAGDLELVVVQRVAKSAIASQLNAVRDWIFTQGLRLAGRGPRGRGNDLRPGCGPGPLRRDPRTRPRSAYHRSYRSLVGTWFEGRSAREPAEGVPGSRAGIGAYYHDISRPVDKDQEEKHRGTRFQSAVGQVRRSAVG